MRSPLHRLFGPPKVTERRLRRILDSYGAAPARWPAGERAAALGLLDGVGPPRESLAAAETLDRALDAFAAVVETPPPSISMLGPAVLRARDAWGSGAETGRGRGIMPAALRPAALAAAVAGLVVGFAAPRADRAPAGVLDRVPVAAVSGAQIERIAVSMLDTGP